MDEQTWSGLAGLAAVVEGGPVAVSGVVAATTVDTVTVKCDLAGGEPDLPGTVRVSVFAPDALYRLDGPATRTGPDLTVGPDLQVERIQRRRWPRRRMDLPVTLCPLDDGRRLAGIPGRTVDVGAGGVCVETLRPIEGEGDPMVIINLPDGTSMVAGTRTVSVEDLGDGWRYRLAFTDLEDHHRHRLAALVEE
jgi:hypothetical protein